MFLNQMCKSLCKLMCYRIVQITDVKIQQVTGFYFVDHNLADTASSTSFNKHSCFKTWNNFNLVFLILLVCIPGERWSCVVIKCIRTSANNSTKSQ